MYKNFVQLYKTIFNIFLLKVINKTPKVIKFLKKNFFIVFLLLFLQQFYNYLCIRYI